MVTKKEAVILGLVAIGGLGIASGIASDSGGGDQAGTQRFGRILGSDGKKVSSDPGNGGSYTYNIAGDAPPSFPAIPSFSMESLFPTPPKEAIQQPKYQPRGGFTGYSSYVGISKKETQLTEAYKSVPDESTFQRQSRLLKSVYSAPSKKRVLSGSGAGSVSPSSAATASALTGAHF